MTAPIIRTNDKYIIDRILTGSGYEIHEATYENSTARGWSVLGLRNKLRELGLYGKKSADKFIPPQYLTAHIEARRALLAGLLDCDGSVRCGGGRGQPHYFSRSYQLARGVQELAESLGMTTSFHQYVDKTDGQLDYTVSINTKTNPFLTPCKAEKFRPSRQTHRTIRSVTRVDDQEIRCISVAAEDQLYVTERYVVTHNSTFAKCLCNHWVDQGYTVLYINFEEAQAHWERILMTQVTGKNIYLGATSEERIKYTKIFTDKMLERGNRFMVRHDPDTSYFDDLEQWLRDIIGHNDPDRNPDVVVIDTIQSLQMKMAGGKPRWGEYEQMMIRLEKLAKDMHCVLLITAQENSNRLKERREIVNASDAGGSLTIVQKSTVTIFITKKQLVSGDDSDDEYLMQLQIPKNRITGTVFMKDPPLVMYNDDTKTFDEFTLNTNSDQAKDWSEMNFEDLNY